MQFATRNGENQLDPPRGAHFPSRACGEGRRAGGLRERHVLLVADHPAYWAFHWANPPTRDTTPIIPDEIGADD
jgi:hypothetical protein